MNDIAAPDLPDAETDPPAEAPAPDYLRSLTRLLIGGLEEGLDELQRLLLVWEEEATRMNGEPPEDGRSPHPARLPATIPGPGATDTAPQAGDAGRDPLHDLLRYAIIGMIFESQEKLTAGARQAGRVSRLIGRLSAPVIKPVAALGSNWLLRPLTRRYAHLVERGASEVERWIARGRREDRYSRTLAWVAFDKTVDEYIEYLTQNPEVKDLVQQQSSSLATEVIEEVRERTVSADTFLEGLARSLLRRLPRSRLPEPPPVVQQSAAPRLRARNPEGER